MVNIDTANRMKLESLSIKNYRALRLLNINFHPDITIIVGRNGAGKTTILDAVAELLKPLSVIWPDDNGATKSGYVPAVISLDDISPGAQECSIIMQFISNVSDDGFPKKIGAHRKRSSGKTTIPDTNDLLQKIREPGFHAPVRPLFVYYNQDRGFKNKGRSNNVFSADAVQAKSLQPDLDAIVDLERWWDSRDAQEARKVRDVDPDFRDPQLEAIRKLVQSIDNFENIYFSATDSPPGLYFTKNDGASIHVNQLSSGERSYIILLADLARRLQVIAPDLPLDKIPGIVLIDEIELNLHPAWQSQIITVLPETFKRCQFIVTTHSPQVISSVASEHVRILEKSTSDDVFVKLPRSTKGRTSNYLLEGIFGAHERFPKIDSLMDNFNDAVDQKDVNNAKKLLLEITNEVEGSPPDLIVLNKRLKKLEREVSEGS